ncbi:MAG: hypothetical protein N2203_07925, partial [Bacteroidia bacterium]|nr:hypothetical protein [Bacteroidia bacterium]
MNINPIYKKLLIITGKILFLSFVIVSMAFVNNEYKKKKVQVINIKIDTSNPRMMCSTEDIELYLNRQFELKNEPYQNIHFNALEKYLNEKNEIKQSAVYFTPDGQLYIRVIEKKPIARIISKKQHYYIDDEWKVFKVTTPYKVPLILGKIYENPEIFRQYP